jgi:intracellular multiplication protein IcmL
MSHKLGMMMVLILISSQLAILGLCYFSYALRSGGEFFGAMPDNVDFQLQPLPRPNVSTKALLSWATLAATATFTIDFVNYEKNIADLRDYFTKRGYESFLKALQETKTLVTINEKKLVLSAVPIGQAVVAAEYDENDIHTWRIEVPITVTYLSVSEEEKQEKLITLTIIQVPTKEASKGIGIDRYVATDLSADVMSK